VCGIFGYVGKRRDAPEIVFEGLKRLEYRGYDSWGIVAKQVIGNKLFLEKHVGKIGNSNLSSKILNIKSNTALGHTRWATHGGVTQANAHPHIDCNMQIALIHNGIIENFQELKKGLGKNHKFVSQTDTEVVAHLVEEESKKSSLKEAIRTVFSKIKGLNALVFVDREGTIYLAKSGTPLVIGLGEGENFLASDPSALLPFTRRMIFVEDGQLAKISALKVEIFDAKSGNEVKKMVSDIDWKAVDAVKGDFEHFMLKEIHDQPEVLAAIAANGKQILDIAKLVSSAKGTFFLGCGSASYAALSGTYLFSRIAKAHVNFSVGSEFNYLEDYLNKKSLVIAISQSGETIDVIQPVTRAKVRKARVVALTNVLGSTLWRIADYKLLLEAGVERAVCATKSYTAMVANLVFLAYAVSGRKEEGRKVIERASIGASKILSPSYVNKIKDLAIKVKRSRDIYIIGRGLSYPTALEATLKLKEVSYIHSEGFAGGELKHGVIALIEKGTPCIVFAPNDETYDETISNAIEIKARGGYIIGVSPKNNDVFDFYLKVDDIGVGSVILDSIPIQLLAYYVALGKGLDPDKPRNLAKSVTVK
jgi:glucosamine--fructose-6-phosphate aminotransferase (isomerizing)